MNPFQLQRFVQCHHLLLFLVAHHHESMMLEPSDPRYQSSMH
uniref:Uncharacterized protein n=1 Tax=Arundo donax TaxID=35708 RepID=A0A0A9F535_ARUDO